MRALVIRIDHLGDLVLTTPLFRALAQAGHKVEVVCRKSSLPVLTGNPNIAGSYAIEDIAPRFPFTWWMLSNWIRRQKPDVILLPHARPALLPMAVRFGFGGRIITMWGGVPARLLGCQALRSGLPGRPRHMSEIWLDLAREMDVPVCGLEPEIFLSPEEIHEAEGFLSRFGNRDFVIVHPGCAGNTCNLPTGVYAELIQLGLGQTDLCFVITGTPAEKSHTAEVFQRFENEPRVWNSMGELNLRQLCAVISLARVVVCVGTGPLHIASALKIPTVSPFCNHVGVSSKVWGNIGGNACVLSPPDSYCNKQPNETRCDFGGTISANSIFSYLLTALSK